MRRLICSLCCSLWIGLAQAESPRAAMAMAFVGESPVAEAPLDAPSTTVVQAVTPPVAVIAPASPAATPAPITLYTATWCGYCRRLKARLAAAHLSYVEYDVEQTEQGRSYARSPDYAGVPLTVAGDVEVVGDDPEALRELLSRVGYPANIL
ncbi:MAG: hypothetical protein RLY58_1010 [Pseudomonadota bacterium]